MAIDLVALIDLYNGLIIIKDTGKSLYKEFHLTFSKVVLPCIYHIRVIKTHFSLPVILMDFPIGISLSRCVDSYQNDCEIKENSKFFVE